MIEIYGLQSFLKAQSNAYTQKKNLQITGASKSFAQLGCLALSQEHRVIVVLPDEKELGQWARIMSAHHDFEDLASELDIQLLPALSRWGYDRFVSAELSRTQRLSALATLLTPRKPSTMILTTLAGLSQTTNTRSQFQSQSIVIDVDSEVDLDELAIQCRQLGYHEVDEVTEEHSFAIRGGIFDIFPPQLPQPVRIEFLADTVNSLRHFHPSQQKSTAALERFTITPATETPILNQERKACTQRLYDFLTEQGAKSVDRDAMVNTLLSKHFFKEQDLFGPVLRAASQTAWDYLAPEDLLVFPDGTTACQKHLAELQDDYHKSFKAEMAESTPTISPELHFPKKELDSIAQNLIEFGNPFYKEDHLSTNYQSRSIIKNAPTVTEKSAQGDLLFDKWVDTMRPLMKNQDLKVAVFANSQDQAIRMQNLFRNAGFESQRSDNLLSAITTNILPPQCVTIGIGNLSSHLWLEETETLVLPDSALFGQQRPKKQRASKKLQNYLKSFRDLKVSDLVVHLHHGIGRYQGLVNMTFDHYQADFLLLEYHGGDRIYLPIDRLNLLQKYSGSEGAVLDKLGSQNWNERKQKIKKKVLEIAKDLLEIHAKRKLAKSFKYPSLDENYFKFEASFPYTETDDQVKAINDIHSDFESVNAMDRLVCGDVGFGKTEVAMRAAFRAVQEGRQVLVLVPTTVLCFQHFRTFYERMHAFGVRISQANRFIPVKQTKENLKLLSEGKLDILIGTHRILSQDIKPANLGLLIIDEEQRFGVTHKEKLKRLKANTDILTLSATPIPRTLQMAMLGLRDISLIATPPRDRLPIKTYVAEFDEALVKRALERELERGGQAFFVHNRVQDIEEVCSFVQSLVPGHKVRFAHGQMSETQLEKAIVDFMEQKFDIMVCTTIIESGVDMPNVNTMIVNRADHFGLAQLYQLRGRVGRSQRQAFAVFLTPSQESISEDALKRLNVLAAHQDLGAGFHIASQDLEIRGAGNLLGAQQSGQVKQVGLELYTQMLDEAIAELKDAPAPELDTDIEIQLPITTTVPNQYIPSESRRLEFYKELFGEMSFEDISGLQAKTRDLYGPLPTEVAILFDLARLKKALKSYNIASLKFKPASTIILKFRSLSESQLDKIISATLKNQNTYKLTPDFKLQIRLAGFKADSLESQFSFLQEVRKTLDSLELLTQTDEA